MKNKTTAVFSHDGKLLVENGDVISILNPINGVEIYRLPKIGQKINEEDGMLLNYTQAHLFAPDGRKIYMYSIFSNDINIFDIKTMRYENAITPDSVSHRYLDLLFGSKIVIGNNERNLLLCITSENIVQVWKTGTFEMIQNICKHHPTTLLPGHFNCGKIPSLCYERSKGNFIRTTRCKIQPSR